MEDINVYSLNNGFPTSVSPAILSVIVSQRAPEENGHGFRGVFSWPFIGVNSPGLAEAPLTRGGCPAVLVSQKGINSLHTMCCLHKGFFVTGEKGQLTPPASQ